MRKNSIKYKKENFWKDFLKLYVPILVAFWVSFFINFTDLYFASKISYKAVAAMQVVFPLFFLLIALNEGFNIATNNLLSKALGENNKSKFNKVLILSFIFALFLGLIFFFFSSYISKFFLSFFNLSEILYNLSFQYINTILKYSFLFFLMGIVFAVLVVLQQKKGQIVIGILSLFLNFVLDYYFISYLGYETYGLAVATSIMLVIVFIYFLIYFFIWKKLIKISLDDFKGVFSYFKTYLSYFLGAFLSLLIFIVEFLFTNYFISQFSDKAMAAYSLSWKTFDFFMYPFLAIVVVFSTMYAYHIGDRNYEMQKLVLKKILKISFLYSLLIVILLYSLSSYLPLLFFEDKEIIYYSSKSLLVFGLFFLAFTYNYIYSQWLQVMGYHKLRIFLNILLVLVIVALEYVSYYYFKSYIYLLFSWLIAQIVGSIFMYLAYKYKSLNSETY